MTLIYVTDTHSLVWYFTDDQHLSKKALKSFESTVKDGQIIVPTVVLGKEKKVLCSTFKVLVPCNSKALSYRPTGDILHLYTIIKISRFASK